MIIHKWNYAFQLIEDENIKGVVSMNETYELKIFSNDGEVSAILPYYDYF